MRNIKFKWELEKEGKKVEREISLNKKIGFKVESEDYNDIYKCDNKGDKINDIFYYIKDEEGDLEKEKKIINVIKIKKLFNLNKRFIDRLRFENFIKKKII